MADNPIGPVPSILASYFRRGGIKEVLTVAEKVGTGLPFINAFRKLYPRDPALSGEEYNSILSYLNTSARVGLEAANTLKGLTPDDPLPIGAIPKNFFLRSKNPLTDQYLVKFGYNTLNQTSGKRRSWIGFEWAPALDRLGQLYDYIVDKIQTFLGWVNTSNKEGSEYNMEETSIDILAIYRR